MRKNGALMKVRTALISSALLLAVLGWACEQGSPTSPTSSLTPPGAPATGAQGQTTTPTAARPGDSGTQQVKGGKGKNQVSYLVDVEPGDFCGSDPSAWKSGSSASTIPRGTLWVTWGNHDNGLEVCPEALGCLSYNGQVAFTKDGGLITEVQFWIADMPCPDCTSYTTDQLSVSVAQDGNLGDGSQVTVHVHDKSENLHLTSGKGRKTLYGTCVGDVVLTPI